MKKLIILCIIAMGILITGCYIYYYCEDGDESSLAYDDSECSYQPSCFPTLGYSCGLFD